MPSDWFRVPILMYHRIDRPNPCSKVSGHYVSPGLFRRQMKAMAALGYHTMPLSRLREGGPDPVKRAFCITFDDGYENYLTNALPELKLRGFTATVFLVTQMVGRENLWDSASGDVREKLLSHTQVMECRTAGTEFGSHTLSHADLSTCSDEEARKQIFDSKEAVEELTGQPTVCFCYPYGRFTASSRDLVKEAGYAVACSTRKGVATPETDRFALPRINVRRDTSVPVLMLKLLRGAYLGR